MADYTSEMRPDYITTMLRKLWGANERGAPKEVETFIVKLCEAVKRGPTSATFGTVTFTLDSSSILNTTIDTPRVTWCVGSMRVSVTNEHFVEDFRRFCLFCFWVWESQHEAMLLIPLNNEGK